VTRVLADYVRNKRNVPASVEFKPGAGATLAPGQIARAEPDGANLCLYSVSPMAVVPHLQKVPYDSLKDFTYIAIYCFVPLAFYVKADSPLKSWADVLRYARDNSGKLRWGTAGVRGSAHIAVEAAFRKEGVKSTFVPFSGGSEAITALLGGHIEAAVSTDYGPQLAAGAVRLLALTGTEKLPSQPALPTFKDLGYPLAPEAIYGIFGPAKLPAPIVAYWDGAIKDMMKTEEFATVMKTVGASPVYMDSAAFTASNAENYRKFGEAIDALGLKK
jgi:tripartite-type tricarboxylate transporter receptor subunit TctC